MTVHTCKVKAAKPFPQATTNPELISKEELPKLAKTPDIMNDQQAKESEPESKTNEFIEELTHFSKANGVQKSKGWHWIPRSCATNVFTAVYPYQ